MNESVGNETKYFKIVHNSEERNISGLEAAVRISNHVLVEKASNGRASLSIKLTEIPIKNLMINGQAAPKNEYERSGKYQIELDKVKTIQYSDADGYHEISVKSYQNFDSLDLVKEGSSIKVFKESVPVKVEFATENGTCRTHEGSVPYKAGDAIMSKPGERWPIERKIFDQSHYIVDEAQGLWVKKKEIILALQMNEPFAVTLASTGAHVHGESGDWLIQYTRDGKSGHRIVSDKDFRDTYHFEDDSSIKSAIQNATIKTKQIADIYGLSFNPDLFGDNIAILSPGELKIIHYLGSGEYSKYGNSFEERVGNISKFMASDEYLGGPNPNGSGFYRLHMLEDAAEIAKNEKDKTVLKSILEIVKPYYKHGYLIAISAEKKDFEDILIHENLHLLLDKNGMNFRSADWSAPPPKRDELAMLVEGLIQYMMYSLQFGKQDISPFMNAGGQGGSVDAVNKFNALLKHATSPPERKILLENYFKSFENPDS